MGKVLFNLLGFDVRTKDLVRLALILFVAVSLYFISTSVRDHFKKYAELKTDNAQLVDNNRQLTDQLALSKKINADNAKVFAAALAEIKDNQTVVASEAAATSARTQAYKDIRNAINAAPPSAAPVGPAVTAAVNGLWGKERN